VPLPLGHSAILRKYAKLIMNSRKTLDHSSTSRTIRKSSVFTQLISGRSRYLWRKAFSCVVKRISKRLGWGLSRKSPGKTFRINNSFQKLLESFYRQNLTMKFFKLLLTFILAFPLKLFMHF
jgi:hypothetical protein